MAKRGRKPFNIKAHIPEIEKLAGQGLNDKEICYRLGFVPSTLYKYKIVSAELTEAIKRGRAESKEKIVNVLHTAALAGSLPAAFFIMKAQFGWRDQGPTTEDHQEETPEAKQIIYQEIDGRVKKRGKKK